MDRLEFRVSPETEERNHMLLLCSKPATGKGVHKKSLNKRSKRERPEGKKKRIKRIERRKGVFRLAHENEKIYFLCIIQRKGQVCKWYYALLRIIEL